MAEDYWNQLRSIHFVKQYPYHVEISIHDCFNPDFVIEMGDFLFDVCLLLPLPHSSGCLFTFLTIDIVFLEMLLGIPESITPSLSLDGVVHH